MIRAPLFDVHLAVHWSAAPGPGQAPIWIAVRREGETRFHTPPTGAEAEALLDRLLAGATARAERVLVGIDAPLGFPAGTARALGAGDWRGVHERIAAELHEHRADPLAAALSLNRAWPGEGPFWFGGPASANPGLPDRPPAGRGGRLPPARRRTEADHPGAPDPWKLGGTRAMGCRALTAIAMLARLRARHPLTPWPFEGPEGPGRGGHVVVEVCPSLLPLRPGPGEQPERAGVRTVAEALAGADRAGVLSTLLGAVPEAPEIRREEGWILGAGRAELLAAHAPAAAPRRPSLRYLRDPAAIYRQSFATVRREARLDRFPPGMDRLAVRVIHACGAVEVADRLAFSSGAFAAGAEALAAGAPVLCDCRMVAAGIIRRVLPAGNRVIVTLDDPRTAELADLLGTTRSAAAVELWRRHLEGAVVAIGNAPTALFHLLERLDGGWPRPAVILGFPVGFVGAAESKAELARDSRGSAFVTLRGRRGGSAIAAAAVNAMAAGLPGEEGPGAGADRSSCDHERGTKA